MDMTWWGSCSMRFREDCNYDWLRLEKNLFSIIYCSQTVLRWWLKRLSSLSNSILRSESLKIIFGEKGEACNNLGGLSKKWNSLKSMRMVKKLLWVTTRMSVLGITFSRNEKKVKKVVTPSVVNWNQIRGIRFQKTQSRCILQF